ncbi:hypothetical protein GCM10010521_62070 [Streptomyces rameus]|uniref:DUF4440 domain-containing protein n=1 Tax=Streptomyces rameus TaxID=68261 RepID=A0ABP6HIM0_9ACTN
MEPLVAGATGSQEEVRAVVTLVAQVEHAQRNGLPDAFTELFRQDAFWTMPYGDPLTGLEEISAFAHRALPGTARQPLTVTYEAESIVFIRPDLAVIKIRQRPITRDGRRLHEVLHAHGDPARRRSCGRPGAAERRWASAVAAHPEAAPGTLLYVLAKDDGRWRIAVAQNTTVIDHGALAAS